MSTEVMTRALPGPAPRQPHTRLRLEHFVMAAAVVALIVLVVLPLAFLLVGSVQRAGAGSASIISPRCCRAGSTSTRSGIR